MDYFGIGERAPWNDFPAVIRNDDLGTLKKEPEYLAAKGGDSEAAFNLVDRLLTHDTVNKIKTLIGKSKPTLLPVLAQEVAGHNKIPLAMAAVLGERLGLDVEDDIVQTIKVGRTGEGADHRLAFNPTFEGKVAKGKDYLLLDDTLTMGGTIASLRGFVENRGGNVIGASVMTAHVGALNIAVKPTMVNNIARKHGDQMDDFFKETFGYGIDKLTQGEAGHLKAAPSVDAIRDRITKARHEGVQRLYAGPTGKQQQDSGFTKQSQAETAETEQTALLEAATVQQTYAASLENYVQKKQLQVDNIENRLELLIDKQKAKLQTLASNSPGVFTLPKARQAWRTQQVNLRSRLQTLNTRLSNVREIKEGMGLHSPKIVELATRRLRIENPELASSWDSMREAERLAKIHEKSRGKNQTKSQGRSGARTLDISKNTPQ